MDYIVCGFFQARILEWVAFPFSRDLPNSGIEPRSLALQADSLPAEPQGKPKNTRVGKLSLLQGVFPIQESNRGLLHCGQILYQLRYQVLYYCNLETKITAANAITSWQIDGDKVEPVAYFFSFSVQNHCGQ